MGGGGQIQGFKPIRNVEALDQFSGKPMEGTEWKVGQEGWINGSQCLVEEAAAGSRLWARPMEALAGVAWCGFRPKSGVSDGFASEVGTLPSSQSSDLRSSVAINDKHKHLHWRPGPTFFSVAHCELGGAGVSTRDGGCNVWLPRDRLPSRCSLSYFEPGDAIRWRTVHGS